MNGNLHTPIARQAGPGHAVAFTDRFGSSLNTHVHLHIGAIDGVFEALSVDASVGPVTPRRVEFHAASGIDEAAVAQIDTDVYTCILPAFAGPGRTWRMDESRLSGPNGETLNRLPAHRAFWFGWHAAFPDTRLVK